MKKIIDTLLRTGYSKTTKYSTQDLEKYLYILRGLFEDTEYGHIKVKSNKFWDRDNSKNRLDLIHDMRSCTKDFKSGRFHIVNRFENGDKYGIDQPIWNDCQMEDFDYE